MTSNKPSGLNTLNTTFTTWDLIRTMKANASTAMGCGLDMMAMCLLLPSINMVTKLDLTFGLIRMKFKSLNDL